MSLVSAALVEGSVVVNVGVFSSVDDIFDNWILCPANVSKGWTYDGSDFNIPDSPDVELEAAMKACENLYSAAMQYVQDENGYTNNEVKTFSRKASAAHEYQSGSPSDQTVYFLAKIDAVVNGSDPSQVDISSEVGGIDADGYAIIETRVAKILAAEVQWDFWVAKIEQIRNTYQDQLTDGPGNQAIVDALAAEYESLKA